MVAVGLMTWAGVALLRDAWLRREKRPDLANRPLAVQARFCGRRGQQWLDKQRLTHPPSMALKVVIDVVSVR